MFPPRLLLIFAGIAATAGFGASWLVSPRLHSTIDEAAPAATRQAAPTISTRPSAYRAQTLPADTMDLAGQALAIVRDGTKADVLRFLEAVAWDPRIPPELESRYLEMLTRRLVELGETSELLSLGSLDIRDQERVSTFAIKAWTERDPVSAEQHVLAPPPGRNRKLAMQSLLETLGRTHPERGLAIINSSPTATEPSRTFFAEWAKRDPLAAANAAHESTQKQPGPGVHGAVMEWAAQDPRNALAWCERLPEPARTSAIASCMERIAIDDPAAAIDLLTSVPTRDHFDAVSVGGIIGSNPELAKELIERVPPGRLRTDLIMEMAFSIAADPADAVSWAKSLLPGEQEKALRNIFNRAAQSDPEVAFQLATTELEGDNRCSALLALFDHWSSTDFDAAFGAAMTLEPDLLKQMLPALYTGSNFYISNPREKLRRISSIDPSLRPEILRDLGMRITLADEYDLVEALDPADRDDFLEGTSVHQNPEKAIALTSLISPARQLRRADDIAEAISYSDPKRLRSSCSRCPMRKATPPCGGLWKTSPAGGFTWTPLQRKPL